MNAILLLGFLMGMRHALEADHLAAVASLATGRRSMGSTVLQGAVWGLGHTITLLVIGGVCLALNSAIPDWLARYLETAVGVMLLILGLDVFRRLRRQRVHLHVHQHPGGTMHLHAHAHPPDQPHDKAQHEHAHPEGALGGRFPHRALIVGMVHGMAGSAALLLLTLRTVSSVGLGLLYIALFGIGSILGMALLSTVIAVPLRLSARLVSGAYGALEVLVGLTALGIGVRVLYRLWG